MNIGFDLISDLNLLAADSFNWEGKATSLYCIVAGNISPDLNKIVETLTHLGKYYHGILYIMGSLEYQDNVDIERRTLELLKACNNIKNVVILYRHVVIIDGVAILGANGWFGNALLTDAQTSEKIEIAAYEDLVYLKKSLEKLQTHLDVKKIIVVTNSVPSLDLYFGEIPNVLITHPLLVLSLEADTQEKVSHWLFGTHEKVVNTIDDGINYVNNPCFNTDPYWAKRIEVEV